MEDSATEFHDWELLHTPTAASNSPHSTNSSKSSDFEADSDDGGIDPHYFALSTNRPNTLTLSSSHDSKGLSDYNDPSWMDPSLDSRYVDHPKGELGFAPTGFGIENPGSFWSEDSSDGRRSRPESEKGEGFLAGEVKSEVGSEGIQKSRDFGVGGSSDVLQPLPGYDKGEIFLAGEAKSEVGFVGIRKESAFSVDESSEGLESIPVDEKGEVFLAGDAKWEVGSEEIVGGNENSEGIEEINAGGEVNSSNIEASSDGNGNLMDVAAGGDGAKKRVVWWKLPLELLKFCAFRVRPVWSISIAAAILGIVMLAKRLYRMKHKSRSIPLKVSLDEKKASQFMVRAARLNEAFSMVKRVPLVRPSLPAGGVTPWPVLGLLS